MDAQGLSINEERLLADLDTLAAIGRTEAGLYRVAWTPAYRQGVDWLKERFAAAGLETTEDAATNVWGRWNVGSGPALVLGSHIDAVPNGGNYDGAFGVFAALEVLRTLREAGVTPPFPLAAVAWADEEGARFGTGFFGSGAFVGMPITDTYIAAAGSEIRDILTAAGARLDNLESVAAQRASVGAYFELHIEQGPRLEAAGAPLAIVSGIVGIERHEWTLTGHPSHAGTTPFPMRRDAGLGMAKAMLALREIAQAAPTETVATVGRLSVTPDVPNIVPGTATFTSEFRSIDADTLAWAQAELNRRIDAICAEERLTADSHPIMVTPSTPMHPAMRNAIAAGAGQLSVSPLTFPSGAGHDAGIIAPHLPTGMLFVPSINGISHAPDEFTTPESLALGANVLLQSALHLISHGLPG
jgi:hydantoinase/carbamoylase family amidase